MTQVLDASCLLAFLQDEAGAELVWPALSDAVVSTVNWSEVLQKSLQNRVDTEGMQQEFEEVGVVFVPFTGEQAALAARLWDATRSHGLSLADRACLALALDRRLPVLTADRAWSSLRLDVRVQLIR